MNYSPFAANTIFRQLPFVNHVIKSCFEVIKSFLFWFNVSLWCNESAYQLWSDCTHQFAWKREKFVQQTIQRVSWVWWFRLKLPMFAVLLPSLLLSHDIRKIIKLGEHIFFLHSYFENANELNFATFFFSVFFLLLSSVRHRWWTSIQFWLIWVGFQTPIKWPNRTVQFTKQFNWMFFDGFILWNVQLKATRFVLHFHRWI